MQYQFCNKKKQINGVISIQKSIFECTTLPDYRADFLELCPHQIRARKAGIIVQKRLLTQLFDTKKRQ
jgi:hypothetical protein